MKHKLHLKHFTRKYVYNDDVMQCENVMESSSAKIRLCSTLYDDIQYTNEQRMFAYVKATV